MRQKWKHYAHVHNPVFCWVFVVRYGLLMICAVVLTYFAIHFFFSFSRPSISHTDLFTCLSLPLTWHLFNRSGYLCVFRHSSVFGKNAVEGMTVTSVQRIHVTATQTDMP